MKINTYDKAAKEYWNRIMKEGNFQELVYALPYIPYHKNRYGDANKDPYEELECEVRVLKDRLAEVEVQDDLAGRINNLYNKYCIARDFWVAWNITNDRLSLRASINRFKNLQKEIEQVIIPMLEERENE